MVGGGGQRGQEEEEERERNGERTVSSVSLWSLGYCRRHLPFLWLLS